MDGKCNSLDTSTGKPCQKPEGWGKLRSEGHCTHHRLTECQNCGLELVEWPDQSSVRMRYDDENGTWCEACYFRAPNGTYNHDGMTLRLMGQVEHIEEAVRS